MDRLSPVPNALPATSGLLSRHWVFASDGQARARQLQLLADGRISGHYHPDQHAWSFHDGRVRFHDIAGRVSVVFDKATQYADGRLTLAGGAHTLWETEPFQQVAPDSTGFPIDVRVPGAVPGRPRRNLVIVFGREDSLHRQWPRDITDDERSWDLCVSFYGNAEHYGEVGFAEFSSLQTGIGKCIAAHAAFGRDSPFWAYDRIWMADDDLMISWSDVNALFGMFGNLGLALAQPSLGPGSHVAHEITRQQPRKLMRTTNFVESMAPIFTRDALALCVKVFDRQVLGWGMDFVWPKLIGPPHGRIGIIDALSVIHTRAPGSRYSEELARQEEATLLAAYGWGSEVQEWGCVMA